MARPARPPRRGGRRCPPGRIERRTSAPPARLREWSDDAVDDWGRDPDLASRVAFARQPSAVAMSPSAARAPVPPRAGALIVVNARRYALAPLLAALALGEAIGRPVRFVGRPDIAPIGPLLQRLGGLLPAAAELAGALARRRAGGDRRRHSRRYLVAAAVDHQMVGAAVAARVRVFPAADLLVAAAPTPRTRRDRRRRSGLAGSAVARWPSSSWPTPSASAGSTTAGSS